MKKKKIFQVNLQIYRLELNAAASGKQSEPGFLRVLTLGTDNNPVTVLVTSLTVKHVSHLVIACRLQKIL